MTRSEKMQKIVDEHQCAKVDGVMVDAFSASAYTKVYNALTSEKAKLKMNTSPLSVVMGIVWQCVS